MLLFILSVDLLHIFPLLCFCEVVFTPINLQLSSVSPVPSANLKIIGQIQVTYCTRCRTRRVFNVFCLTNDKITKMFKNPFFSGDKSLYCLICFYIIGKIRLWIFLSWDKTMKCILLIV